MEYDKNLVEVGKRAVTSEFLDDIDDMAWFVRTHMTHKHPMAEFCHFIDPDGPSIMKGGPRFDAMVLDANELNSDSEFTLRHGLHAIYYSVAIPSVEWSMLIEHANRILEIYEL